MHLLLASFFEQDFSDFAMWGFLAIGAIALFGVFLPINSWVEERRREREAYYKAETLRRIAESTSEGAKAAIDLIHEQDRQARQLRMERTKRSGVTNLFLGIALVFFLYTVPGGRVAYLCGLLPAAIGLAKLIYAFFLAPPAEQ